MESNKIFSSTTKPDYLHEITQYVCMRNSYEKYENSIFTYKKAVLKRSILAVKSSLQLKPCPKRLESKAVEVNQALIEIAARSTIKLPATVQVGAGVCKTSTVSVSVRLTL